MLLHRHARVIGNLLAKARQLVEECGLTGVGWTDQRDHRSQLNSRVAGGGSHYVTVVGSKELIQNGRGASARVLQLRKDPDAQAVSDLTPERE
jgi:hypothetical protein